MLPNSLGARSRRSPTLLGHAIRVLPLTIVICAGEERRALRARAKFVSLARILLQGLFGSIKIDKRLDPLRHDARFQKLVERFDAGIPE